MQRETTGTGILRLGLALALALGAGAAAAAELAAPAAVSPGSATGVAQVEARCPTFSWGAVEGAEAYELVVYELDASGAGALEPSALVLSERHPVGVSSWTPPLESCLAAGGRYAWAVRALAEGVASEWSAARLFEVAAGPGEVALERAVELLLERFLAEGGSLERLGLAAAGSGREPPAGAPGASGGAQGALRARPAGEPLLLPGVAAIRGEQPDATGETYGVYGVSQSSTAGSSGVAGEATATSGAVYGLLGVSASAAGAGVAASNAAGGADLELVDAAGASAYLSESGLDRAAATDVVFGFGNSGAGTMTLRVDDAEVVTTLTDRDTLGGLSCASGELAKWNGSAWACAPDADSGGTVLSVGTGTGLTGGPITTTGTVSVAAGGITTTLLGNNAVTSAKIADGAVGLAQIDAAQVQARVGGTCPPGRYLRGINPDGTVVCEALPSVPTVITTVDDPANDVGAYTSIAIGSDGLPVISYLDFTAGALKVAHCGNGACTAGNAITSVDDPANAVGFYTSIAIGSDGLPVISYLDYTAGALKVVHCGAAACTGGNTITTVDDPANFVGQGTSIAIGIDNLPVISYQDVTAFALKVAHCGNTTCTAGNTITTVDDPANLVDQFTSIAIGSDGLPVISYFDATAGALKVAHCGNATCTAGNTITTVDDPANRVGSTSSIAIGSDGLPVISYTDETASALRVAHCGNSTCTAGNTITTVDDPANFVGSFTSIAIGPDGLPIISYQDVTAFALKVAHCGNTTCTAGNTITTVDDPANQVGSYTSIAIGSDGLPVISYRDIDGVALKVAKCGTRTCQW